MRALRLDPADTRPEELYRALVSAVETGIAERLLAKAEYTLLEIDGQVISFAHRDAVLSAHEGRDFDQRSLTHGRRALRGELLIRYIADERTDDGTTNEIAVAIGLVEKQDKENFMDQSQNNQSATSSSSAPYMLAIGDIFTDAFIKLNDDTSKIIKDDDGRQWLAVEFGAKMPYDYVDNVRSVGPSPNAAVSFSRLGLRAGLMTYLGDDEVGKE